MAGEVINRGTLRVCWSYSAIIKLVSGQKHGAIVATAAGTYQDQEWTGVSAGFIYVRDTFIVSCSLFCGVLSGAVSGVNSSNDIKCDTELNCE